MAVRADRTSTRIRTTCNRDCPDACGIVATVLGDRVVRIQGDKEHPVTRGFLCERTSRYLERQYDPTRLTTPLMRRSTTDAFEPVSWDAALDAIAARMLAIRAESGGAAIFHYRSGGAMGIMKHLTDWFFERFGPVTVKTGDVCSGAGEWAQEQDFGLSDSHDFFDLAASRTIVLWGRNPHVTGVHLLPVLREARARGARLVLIDPVRHRGADLCQMYVQPRPGGDIALGLAVARRLFETGRTDPGAVAYCDHLDEFRALACERSIEEWARIADVSPRAVIDLADAYAEGPAAILVGWGMQRRAHGAATVRVLDALGAVSGNLGVAGGGVSFYFKRRGAFDMDFIRGEAAAPRAILDPLTGPQILAARDPGIRMVWITAANPVAMLPESETVKRAFESRELTVVVDSFMTDTARAAHVVLPTTTMLEDDDLLGAYGHHWLAVSRPVVSPPFDVKSDYEIIAELARRVGLGADFSAGVADWKRRFLARVADRGASLEALERGAVRNPLAPRVLYADRRFATPSGKVNLIRAIEGTAFEPVADHSLFLLAMSTAEAQSSQWLPGAQEGPAPAVVHPESAPGFADGANARLESDIGSIVVRLVFDARQRRDLVIMQKGGWLSAGRCANALIPARATDAGGCAVYYDTAVRIAPLD